MVDNNKSNKSSTKFRILFTKNYVIEMWTIICATHFGEKKSSKFFFWEYLTHT